MVAVSGAEADSVFSTSGSIRESDLSMADAILVTDLNFLSSCRLVKEKDEHGVVNGDGFRMMNVYSLAARACGKRVCTPAFFANRCSLAGDISVRDKSVHDTGLRMTHIAERDANTRSTESRRRLRLKNA